jgi:predicted nucleotidyltransferase component of viral defense system
MFALKGGTAINLFVQDMPRLSVDLDLVYTDHRAERETALDAISSELLSLQDELSELGISCEMGSMADGSEVKLFAQKDRTRVKVPLHWHPPLCLCLVIERLRTGCSPAIF